MTTVSHQGFFGYFGLRENPFHVSPNPRFYHSTPAHDSARQELLFGLQTRQGLLVLTGEAGTGKTTLLNSVLDNLARRGISTAYVFHPLLEPIELFECILRDFGVSYSSNRKVDLLGALRDWLIGRETAGDCPVVVIDEAQSLTLHMLDELRLLLNLETPRGKLLQIILAGQTKLEEKLRRPELRQLRQRVMFHCKLTTLSEEQTAAYVQTRLAHAGVPTPDLFLPEALQSIHTHAKGIPRVINLLCEHALITAYGEQQHSIAAEAIQRIAADFDLSANPISTEDEFSGSRLGRFQMFSVAEAKLDALLPFDEPPSISPLQTMGGERELAEIAASPVTPEFVSLKLPEHESEPSVAAPLQSVDVYQELAEIAASPVTPQFVTPKVHGSSAEPSAAAIAKSTPLLGAPSPGEVRSPWRSYRSRVELPLFIRRSAEAFASYWREVGRSFVRDTRYFFKPVMKPSQAQGLTATRNQKAAQHRNPLRPVANWLRHPMVAGHSSGRNHSRRSAAQK